LFNVPPTSSMLSVSSARMITPKTITPAAMMLTAGTGKP
jgi:hypothetical protein